MKNNPTCGICVFHNREKTFERKCSELGKLPTSKGCNSFKPDPFGLLGTDQKLDRLAMLSKALHGMSATELQHASALISYQRHTIKYGFTFMEKVYIRFTGTKNYLSNFCVGRIVYVDKDAIRVVGKSGKVFLSFFSDGNGNYSGTIGYSLYTAKQFEPMRLQMVKDKAFVDPTIKAYVPKPHIIDLDEASERKVPEQAKIRKSSSDDLVSLVSRMQRGVVRGPKKPKKYGSEIDVTWG